MFPSWPRPCTVMASRRITCWTALAATKLHFVIATIKEIIAAAVSETGLDHPQGSTLREQLLAIAEVCGISTGTNVENGLD